MYYKNNLGRDELKPANPAVFFVAPTDTDKAITVMSRYLLDQYGGDWRWYLLPWLHPNLNRLLGASGGKVKDFILRYIDTSREVSQVINEANRGYFADVLIDDYGYDKKTIEEYIDALLLLKAQGKIPQNVLKPFYYEPTTLSEDITNVTGAALEPIGKKLLPWTALILIGGAAAYGLTTKGLPGTVESIVD